VRTRRKVQVENQFFSTLIVTECVTFRWKKKTLDFKHSPCCECCILSFGWIPRRLNFMCRCFETPCLFHLHSSFKQAIQIECSETSAYKIQTPGNYPNKECNNKLPVNQETGADRLARHQPAPATLRTTQYKPQWRTVSNSCCAMQLRPRTDKRTRYQSTLSQICCSVHWDCLDMYFGLRKVSTLHGIR